MNAKRLKILLPGIVLIAAGLVLAGVVIMRVTPKGACNTIPEGLSAGGVWTTGVPVPTIRAETTATTLDGKIYMAGGIQQGYGGVKAFEAFDPATNTWEKRADMPEALHHVGLIVANDRIYMIGGYDDIAKMVRAEPDIARNYVYDATTDSWSEIAPMPAPRAALAVVNIDEKLYVVGGTGVGAQDVWVYDPATDTWDTSRKGQLPTPREHVSAFAYDGKVYLIGGRWKNINTPVVEIYDPATDTWGKGADMPTATSGYMGAVLDNKVHILAGEFLDRECVMAGHQVYDPATDTWTQLSTLGTLRHGSGSAVVDDRWYVIGGSTEVGLRADVSITDKMEIFTPDKSA